MAEVENKINPLSNESSWQKFLDAMINFMNTRVKGEPTAELYEYGLKVYLNFPGSISASLFIMDTDGFLFNQSISVPKLNRDIVQKNFDALLNAGAVASSLQTSQIIKWESEGNQEGKQYFMITPLVDSNGVTGLVIIESSDNTHHNEQLLLGLSNLHSHQFTLLINNVKLLKELRNTQSVLEQKISYRTEDLRKSKRELQLILDSIHTGVFIIDPKTKKVVDTNRAALDILKMPREWIIDSHRDEFYGESKKHESVRENNISELVNGESSLKSRSGSEIPIIRTMSNINFGDQVFILESFIDISERKTAIKALLESETRFRTIFEQAGIGMVIQNLDGVILEANSAFCKILGYESSDVIKKSFYDFILHEDRKKKSLNDDSKKQYTELRFVKKSGNIVWGRVISTYMYDTDNNPIFGVKMLEDISESKLHEETLERQTNLLNGVADATTTLLSELDFEKAISQALKMIGTAAAVDRVFIYEYKSEGEALFLSRKHFWAKSEKEKLTTDHKNFEFRINKKNSSWYSMFVEDRTICGLTKNVFGDERDFLEYFHVKSYLAVPININNILWGVVGLNDCYNERMWTENEESILKATAVAIGGALQRNRYHEELLRSKEKAEKAVKLKTEFLAQMSHEIRTPINSILNFSGIIKEELSGKIDDDLRTGLKIIDKAGKRIIRTVDLILNMSDIQTGHYEYQPARINLVSDILEKQYLEFIQHARNKNIDFRLHKPTFSTMVECDEYTMNQVFNNLFDNAIKYTMKGNVDVKMAKNDGGAIEVAIQDTGIGISEKYMPKLFEPFTQEEQGYTRKFEGNGLGLALVKKYCELNKVLISVDSVKGEGSTFRVTFPPNR